MTKEFEIIIAEEWKDGKHYFKIVNDADVNGINKIVDDVLAETKIKISGREYHSKINAYVMIDHEPFAIENYYRVIYFDYSKENENKVIFIKNILSDWISKVNKLNKVLELTV